MNKILHSPTDRKQIEHMLINANFNGHAIVLDSPHTVTDIILDKYDYVIGLINIHDGGHHWLAYHKNGSDGVCVFDSYGLNPEHNSFYDVRECITDPHKVVYTPQNYTGFQSPSTAVCGEYCVAFILNGGSVPAMRSRIGLIDVSDTQILNNHGNTHKYIKDSQQAYNNDKKLAEYIKPYIKL